ncbi:MAG: hypothetical protein KAW17_00040 [Candidatus Eisenbacteria sp.]|nr:hypothetical protein [Candidatus Eisenbacteria bacterium]
MRIRSCRLVILGLGVILVACSSSAQADEIHVTEPVPTKGRPTEVVVETAGGFPQAGAEVSVVYRPGSEVEHCGSLGITAAGGSVPWTPKEAGIARLSAAWADSAGNHNPAVNVSIRFHSVPLSGVIVAILAGLILYGTVAYGFRKLRS